MPIVTAYQTTFMETTVSALFVDRVTNLIDEGLDVGIRIGALPDSSLRAIRVGQVRRVVCASPAHLEKYGTPRIPADLAQYPVMAASSLSGGSEWTFARGKQRIGVRLSPRILANTNDGLLEAAKSGFGLTRLNSYQVAKGLAARRLMPVLTDFDDAVLPIHVIHRKGRHGSAKVRRFVDLAMDRLSANAALQ